MTAPGLGAERRTGERRSARKPVGELVFAVLMLALGVFAFTGVFTIRVPVGGQVGPTVFPLFVSILLIGASAAAVIGVLRGRRAEIEESEDIDESLPTDWLTLVKVAGAVVAHLLLIEVIGWAPAAAILFGIVTWALGARRWWLGFVIGLALALVVQIVFAGILGLSLPWGLLFGWLGGVF